MASAYQCDRCNRFYSKDEKRFWTSTNRLKISQAANSKEITVDLCPDCQYDLDRWFSYMNSENTEDTDDDT